MATVKAQQKNLELSSDSVSGDISFTPREPQSILWTMVNICKSFLLKSVAHHQHLVNLYSGKSLVTGKRF